VTLDLVRRLSPDLLVLDLHMPSSGGGEMSVLEAVRSERPATHVIVTSADDRHRRYVRSRGADWVGKDEGIHALVGAVLKWAGPHA
jgi:DNA-binding NarL/FixJ family response regulator